MRSEIWHDQAAGLRRLLGRSPARVFAVVGARAGVGATTLVANLARVFALSGKEVLVLDEHHSHENVAHVLGLRARYELLHVARGDKGWKDVVLHDGGGVSVLPMARAVQALPELLPLEHERQREALLAAAAGKDIVLVDAARAGHSVSAALSVGDALALVLDATPAGITEGYALLKHMTALNGRQAFDIVVNRAGSEREALAVYDNMAQVARRHLQAGLNYLGHIPVDENLRRATQLHCAAVEATPSSDASYALREIAQGLLRGPESTDGALDGAMRRLMRRPPAAVVRGAAARHAVL